MSFDNDKLRTRASAAYVWRTLESSDALRDIDFSNNFNALEIDVNLDYEFTKRQACFLDTNLTTMLRG